MARKVSKKKRDAAKRAASENKRQNSPPAPAQECAMDKDHQDAGCDEFNALALYEETKELTEYASQYFARADFRGISDELRIQGNEKYTSLHDGLAPTIYASRLQASVELYQKAVSTASTADQLASASKNLGFAHRKHASMERDFEPRMRNLCTAVRHLGNAFVFGAACKPAAWRVSVGEDAVGCIDALKDALGTCSIKQPLRWLEKMNAAVPDAWSTLKADKKPKIVLAMSGEELGAADHMLCKHLMEDASRPIEDAARFSRVARWCKGMSDAEVLRDDMLRNVCICSAIEEMKRADAFLDRALYSAEDIDMDAIFLAIDAYRNAILLTRGNDLKAECRAFSRLGRVYGKIMNDRQRAADCNKRCIVLASTIYPIPYGADWYREATAELQAEQKRTALEEEQKLAQERGPILETLKEELRALKKAHSEGAHKLVDLIYKEHPPKKEKAVKPDVNGENMKKGLQTAILHYHPDKNAESIFGKRWCYLCEEITKLLNDKYEHTKGC
ncbi:hypothetical protein COCSUDRAFT_58649 [Coccomyxa subellipsoidea C-169]|uniref:J domain-containing protein n=1 Tax=Coccomyxa subellipsoidea (strain C-169) TaxID=574566 RepID=I0YLT8_COCSC|nr:hypothetical protein COCSUDRAFT_58649 [Coccomyxa subellipsoidea C-169]EIE19357.1 hypothetical protein COCSUDRAFT_58649 [Coccomyxa subellipsoidea C-169]|eukprot:XP_005643901.1 hypothetical protein COCSUDRAFT_58649 [Coccomyxa subellipsoidea C-169]